MNTLSACAQPQAMVDRTPVYDGQIKKGRKKMSGVVLSKRGFHRPDMRMRKKVRFL